MSTYWNQIERQMIKFETIKLTKKDLREVITIKFIIYLLFFYCENRFNAMNLLKEAHILYFTLRTVALGSNLREAFALRESQVRTFPI